MQIFSQNNIIFAIDVYQENKIKIGFINFTAT